MSFSTSGPGEACRRCPRRWRSPHWRWVLVEAQLRRADHLLAAVRRLGVGDRVEVRHVRAEDLGRDPSARGRADAVTARSFGPSAVVAECAAPLLRLGGRLLVSEPPTAAGRWPDDGLAEFGLSPATSRQIDGATIAVLQQVAVCPPGFPRRAGVPRRRPRF